MLCVSLKTQTASGLSDHGIFGTVTLTLHAHPNRRARLWNGLKRWHARSISTLRQQRSYDAAYKVRRSGFLRQGLASFSTLKQVNPQAGPVN